jgi:hypothetical protein
MPASLRPSHAPGNLRPPALSEGFVRHFFPFVVASLAAVALFAPRAGAAPSAAQCVAFQRTETSTGLLFDVQNNCDKELACTLGWTVTCENSSGKATSTSRQAARFTVDAQLSHSETGSAASCTGAGWRIDDVSWSCAPVK